MLISGINLINVGISLDHNMLSWWVNFIHVGIIDIFEISLLLQTSKIYSVLCNAITKNLFQIEGKHKAFNNLLNKHNNGLTKTELNFFKLRNIIRTNTNVGIYSK